jgi:hypothetical protein
MWSAWKQNNLKLPKKKTTDRQTMDGRVKRKTYRMKDRYIKGINVQIGRRMDKQIGTNGQIGRQNDREKEINSDGQTERQTNR